MRDPFKGRHRKHTHRKPLARRIAGKAVFAVSVAAVSAGVMAATAQPAPPPFNVPAQLGQTVQAPPDVQLTADMHRIPMHHVTVRLNADWTCTDPYALYWVHVRGTHINFEAVCVTIASGRGWVNVLQPESAI